MSEMSFRAVLEDIEDPTEILLLLEAVYAARDAQKLRLEEEVCYHIIQLLRRPEEFTARTNARRHSATRSASRAARTTTPADSVLRTPADLSAANYHPAAFPPPPPGAG
jgi:hypothetical protein